VRWQWLQRRNLMCGWLHLYHSKPMVSPMCPRHKHQSSSSKHVGTTAARHDHIVRFASSSFHYWRHESATVWVVSRSAFKPWISKLEPP
jgi:hypothetical protein